MTWYTATARVESDYSAHIMLRSDTPWPTNHWVVEDLDDENWLQGDARFLYDFQQEGDGSPSPQGSTYRLFIVIPHCPRGRFLLTVGDFAKVFDLREDGEDQFQTFVVGTGDVRAQETGDAGYHVVEGPNLILFNGGVELLTGSISTAGLFQDNLQVGWAIGTTFSTVYSISEYQAYHPYAGVLFNRFFWFNDVPDSVVEEYSFIPRRVSLRGSDTGIDFRHRVELSDIVFPSPTSAVYTVAPTDVFYLDGRLV